MIILYIIILFLILILLKIKIVNKEIESFITNDSKRFVENVNEINRTQKNEKNFTLYSGFGDKLSRYYYNPNDELNSKNVQNILNRLITKKKFNIKFSQPEKKLLEKKKKNNIYHEWEDMKIMNINDTEIYDYWNGYTEIKFNNDIYKLIKYDILSNINKEIFNNYDVKNYDSIHYKHTKINGIKYNYDIITSKMDLNKSRQNIRIFIEIDDTLISFSYGKKDNIMYYNYIFILNIYRPFKFLGYQVYFSAIYNLKKKIYDLVEAKVISPIQQQEISILPGYDSKKKKQKQLYYKFPTNPYQGKEHAIRTSEDSKVLASKDQTINILREKRYNKILNFMDNSFSCYGGKGNDYFTCTSNIDNLGRPTRSGIWDKPCVSDIECPFFLGNRNYLNDRGGCVNGYCEMPIGVERLTYRNYNMLTPAQCYNCKDNSIYCCEEQKANRKKYPNCITPDYAFAGDHFERYRQKEILKKRGLKWIEY